MSTVRSYGELCGISRALDAVGERWAMLIVRELMLGPRRFSDLRSALPASSNILTDRLNELVARGVVRQVLRHDATRGRHLYELTEAGVALVPVLVQLGDWGATYGTPSDDPRLTRLSPTSVLVYAKEHLDPESRLPSAVIHAVIDDHSWTLRARHGRLTVHTGRPDDQTTELRTDAFTLDDVLHRRLTVDEAAARGSLVLVGDEDGARAVLAAVRPAGDSVVPDRTGAPLPDLPGTA